MAYQYILLDLGYEVIHPPGQRCSVPAICEIENFSYRIKDIVENRLEAVECVIETLLKDESFREYSLAYTDTSVVLKHKSVKTDIIVNLTTFIPESKALELEELLGINVYRSLS